MRAIAITFPGPDGRLEVTERPEPTAGFGQVTISVERAGVTFADLMQLGGQLPVADGHVPGLEVVGHVVSVGTGVTELAEGDRVAALTLGGGYAEVAVASASLTRRVPDGIDAAVAAALPCAGAAAVGLVTHVSHARAGQSVLITAAAGAVGTMSAQLARAAGCTPVVGLVSSDARATALLELDLVDEVLVGDDAIGPRTFDIVLDAVGGPLRAAAFERLTPYGQLVVYGNASAAAPLTVDAVDLWRTGRTVAGFSVLRLARETPELAGALLEETLGHVAAGTLRPPLDESFALTDAPAAAARVRSRRGVGKVTLRP